MQSCFHGGGFWRSHPKLQPKPEVINADVLDAWFNPAPAVLRALAEDPGWVSRTSPPTHSDGLRLATAEARGVDPTSLMVGPGSSALLFNLVRELLPRSASVLLIEPTYGEYAHLASLAGAHVETILTMPANGFALDVDVWCRRVRDLSPTLAVLVNPNNPTGSVLSEAQVTQMVCAAPPGTTILLDEAYIDYTGQPSSEHLVASHPNLVVVKSMSKAYALSGMRVAYLVAHPSLVERVSRWSPPWWVSLPAQVAAIAALSDPDYYKDRYRETAHLRVAMLEELEGIGYGCANWILMPSPDAETITQRLERKSIYIRNAGRTAPSLGNGWIRIAVKDRLTNARLLEALRSVDHMRDFSELVVS